MQQSKFCSHFRSYNTALLPWHLLLWFRDLSCKIYIFVESNRSAMHHYNDKFVDAQYFSLKISKYGYCRNEVYISFLKITLILI